MIQLVKQRYMADQFLKLHTEPGLFVLPNAWDVTSAKIFELEGFKAVGTTSAGISSTLGYPDGERMSLEENMEVVRRIVNHVKLPVSVDIESGYSSTTEGIVMSAKAVWEAGAVGLNLEDSTGRLDNPLYPVSVMKERIGAIRDMLSVEGICLVLNIRTDVYLVSGEHHRNRFRQTVDRANAYLEAGADCIFVPDMGDLDRNTIADLVREIDAPLNIIAGVNTPPIHELEEIGVSRVSLGPRPMRAVLARLREIAREISSKGTYSTMTDASLSYQEVNDWFGGHH